MKGKHRYIVACIIIPVILISVVCGSLIVPKIIFKQKWASSVQKLYEHLQVEPYETLEITGVSVGQVNINQKKENRLRVTCQFTSAFFTTSADKAISESLALKQSVESFFLKYPDLFPNMLIEVKIEHENDSGPDHIRIANHNEQTNFVSANRNQLGYGAFYCTYGDASYQYIEKGTVISRAESDKTLYNVSRLPYHENSHDMAFRFKILAFSSIMVYNVYNCSTYEVDNHD